MTFPPNAGLGSAAEKSGSIALLALLAGVLGVLFLVLWRMSWMYNQVADISAAHCLLRATELCVKLRDPGVDSVSARREITGQLGHAASYVRRHVGKVLPLGVRRQERPEVARQADALAGAIRRLQVELVTASRADVVAAAVRTAELLAAWVEDRPGDLLGAGEPARAAAVRRRVFLCYSRVDRREVDQLWQRLVQDGHQPWYDTNDMLPGDEWRQVVDEAIRSSETVLVCLSRAALGRRGFYQREVRAVVDVAEEMPDGARFVVPIRLDNCTVPPELAVYHWVDLFEPDGYARLNAALAVASKRDPDRDS